MTAEEVKQEVVFDLRNRNLKRRDAGALLGIKPQSVTNMLAAKGYFSAFQARRLHDCFGYDMEFLMTGEGVLMSGEPKARQTVEGAFVSASFYVDILEEIVEMNRKAMRMTLEKDDLEAVRPVLGMLEIYVDSVTSMRNLLISDVSGNFMNFKDSFAMLNPMRDQLRELLGMKKEEEK